MSDKQDFSFSTDENLSGAIDRLLAEIEDEKKWRADIFVGETANLSEEAVTESSASQPEEATLDTKKRVNPFAALGRLLYDSVPLVGEPFGTVLRKSFFWVALIFLCSSATYIMYQLWWQPEYNNYIYQQIAEEYNPDDSEVVSDIENYPFGMLNSFKTLYDRNPDIRGWLTFHSTEKTDFLKVDYPIMYSGDNEKYLKMDFNGNKNKNGALFFDASAQLNTALDYNQSLIVYGHNMASGQMLAGLNKLLTSLTKARSAATLTMSTLFQKSDYKVIAFILTDEDAEGRFYLNYRRTEFGTQEDFLSYVEMLRAHSLYDYPVDVVEKDQLLILSTCTAPSSAKVKNGRAVLVARRVRYGEDSTVDTSQIVKNSDVIMPLNWYILQDQQPHDSYNVIVNNKTIAWKTTTETVNETTAAVAANETTTTTSVSGATSTGTTDEKGGTTKATEPTASAGTSHSSVSTEATEPSATKPSVTDPTTTPTQKTDSDIVDLF